MSYPTELSAKAADNLAGFFRGTAPLDIHAACELQQFGLGRLQAEGASSSWPLPDHIPSGEEAAKLVESLRPGGKPKFIILGLLVTIVAANLINNWINHQPKA